MSLRAWRFVTLLLATLSLTMESAHVLELPQKLSLDATPTSCGSAARRWSRPCSPRVAKARRLYSSGARKPCSSPESVIPAESFTQTNAPLATTAPVGMS